MWSSRTCVVRTCGVVERAFLVRGACCYFACVSMGLHVCPRICMCVHGACVVTLHVFPCWNGRMCLCGNEGRCIVFMTQYVHSIISQDVLLITKYICVDVRGDKGK